MKGTRKAWKWTHNGFHGRSEIKVMVPADAKVGDVIEVSYPVARRLNANVCGITDCQCGECVATEEGWTSDDGVWQVELPVQRAEVRGSYPQNR